MHILVCIVETGTKWENVGKKLVHTALPRAWKQLRQSQDLGTPPLDSSTARGRLGAGMYSIPQIMYIVQQEFSVFVELGTDLGLTSARAETWEISYRNRALAHPNKLP